MTTQIHSYLKKRNPLVPHVAGAGPWKPADLCKAYDWPTKAPGTSKPVGIYEAGGGWTAADLAAFGKANGLPTVPTITDVSVDGTTNTPGGDADGEVALDQQLLWASYWNATIDPATGLGLVPKINMYWGADLAAAIARAAADGCCALSISWGADEATWGVAGCQAIEAAAAAALAQTGMVTFAASGDNDSSDGGPTPANVDCPASCPSIIGCGGTTKALSSEVVWNDNPGNADGSGTGGGYSTVFAMPAWQASGGAAAGPGRMVPDVAANADPNTGYEIVVGGQAEVVGGTSAVAPLMTGLYAAQGASLSPVTAGLGPVLWSAGGRPCFTLITTGDNGAYAASDAPDPCTGLGAPIGVKIAALLASAGSGGGLRS